MKKLILMSIVLAAGFNLLAVGVVYHTNIVTQTVISNVPTPVKVVVPQVRPSVPPFALSFAAFDALAATGQGNGLATAVRTRSTNTVSFSITALDATNNCYWLTLNHPKTVAANFTPLTESLAIPTAVMSGYWSTVMPMVGVDSTVTLTNFNGAFVRNTGTNFWCTLRVK